MLPSRYWFVVGLVLLAGCGSRPRVTLPAPTPARLGGSERGIASWYGHPYHGRRTSNGEIYDMDLLTAAHLSLPFDTWVRVTNLENRRWVDVRINDRGPFIKNRIIDLSRAGAQAIGMIGPGTARVQVEVVGVPGRAYASERRPLPATPVSYTPPQGNSPQGEPSEPDSALAEEAAVLGEGDPEGCPGGPFYSVQVGSFRDIENAERMRGKMTDHYGVARLIEVGTGEGALFRVVVGQLGDASAARRLLERLGRDRVDGYVLRVDPAATLQCL
jgi:rare lipoprotein A